MSLGPDAARGAIERVVAEPLGLDAARAAWGIHDTANEDVARAFRVLAAEHGFDYRRCSMIAFGGSGPVHALRIARKLKVPEVVFPAGAGVMSAFGLLATPTGHEIIQSGNVFVDELTPATFAERFRVLADRAAEFLAGTGVDPADFSVIRRLDMRYRGQGYDIEVQLPTGEAPESAFPKLSDLFGAAYAEIFSISSVEQPLEITNWKVEILGPRPSLGDQRAFLANASSDAAAAVKGTRSIWVAERGFSERPVYDRYLLKTGAEFVGPALVQERESTCVIGDGDRVTVDEHRNLVASFALAA